MQLFFFFFFLHFDRMILSQKLIFSSILMQYIYYVMGMEWIGMF